MIRVAHIITGLAPQGAEAMLYKLVLQMDPSGFANEIISLTNWHEQYADWQSVSEQLSAAGIKVRALRMRRGMLNPWQALRLMRWIGRSRPDVVHSWMYHANLVGGIAARLAGVPVIWGIHHTNLDPGQNKRHTIWTARACARLSNTIPSRIVCCSESARRVHADYGYAAQKLMMIPNGFDLNYFRPDSQARSSLRRELGIPQDARLIGVAARFHALKGHRNFLEAAARLHAVLPYVHFVLCGRDVDSRNSELAAWIRASGPGLSAHCHLLGVRQDMPRFFSALDIATSPSVSEALPSAVGEAMACGTPCVVTDVGDSAVLVGDTGKVVPSGDPKALAEAWQEWLTCEPVFLSLLGGRARQRIRERFAVGVVAERYQQVYREVVGQASSVAAEANPPVDAAAESANQATATASTSTWLGG